MEKGLQEKGRYCLTHYKESSCWMVCVFSHSFLVIVMRSSLYLLNHGTIPCYFLCDLSLLSFIVIFSYLVFFYASVLLLLSSLVFCRFAFLLRVSGVKIYTNFHLSITFRLQ